MIIHRRRGRARDGLGTGEGRARDERDYYPLCRTSLETRKMCRTPTRAKINVTIERLTVGVWRVTRDKWARRIYFASGAGFFFNYFASLRSRWTLICLKKRRRNCTDLSIDFWRRSNKNDVNNNRRPNELLCYYGQNVFSLLVLILSSRFARVSYFRKTVIRRYDAINW